MVCEVILKRHFQINSEHLVPMQRQAWQTGSPWDYRLHSTVHGTTGYTLQSMGLQATVHSPWDYRLQSTVHGTIGYSLQSMGLQATVYRPWDYRLQPTVHGTTD